MKPRTRKTRRRQLALRYRKKGRNQKGGYLGALLAIGTTALRYAPRIASTVARHVPKLARRYVPKLIKKGIKQGFKQGVSEGVSKAGEKIINKIAESKTRKK